MGFWGVNVDEVKHPTPKLPNSKTLYNYLYPPLLSYLVLYILIFVLVYYYL